MAKTPPVTDATAIIDQASIPRDVLELCRTLSDRGYGAWVVGGCLRDLLRGKPAADWDLATSARPEQVQAVFPRVIPTGIQHGTVTVRHRGKSYEVTTLRGEGAYSDGRRPDRVEFVTDIVADLSRRDFTVNAIAFDPLSGVVTDPFGGVDDLERGVIRAVGDAAQRFSEDGLRVLRAARFAATLEFRLDPETEAAIRPTLETFKKVSGERVRDEWLKALKARTPSRAFDVMARTGILDVTAGTLALLPDEDWQSALEALDRCHDPDVCVQLAALFHPVTDLAWIEEWLVRYRFSNQERARVLTYLRHHTEPGRDQLSDADVRRFARKVGREMALHVARFGELVTSVGADDEGRLVAEARRFTARVERLVLPEIALSSKELAISGRDLMQAFTLAPGPVLGRTLDALLELVLDDPERNTRDELLRLSQDLLKEPQP